jgi:aspartyl-tRNA(Asn)/glutamyl-tRNA(Gln) amidotransferase subunit B
MVVTDELLEMVRSELPEMPDVRSARFESEWRLPKYDAEILTEERATADYFEETLSSLFKRTGGGNTHIQAKAVSNVIMTDVMRVLNEESLTIEEFPIEPERLAELVQMRLDDEISSSAAQEIFNAMTREMERPSEIARMRNLTQVSDEGALRPIVEKVIEENPKQVKTYLSGKEGLIGYFIGQVMRNFEGAPDPKMVRKLLAEKLEEQRA